MSIEALESRTEHAFGETFFVGSYLQTPCLPTVRPDSQEFSPAGFFRSLLARMGRSRIPSKSFARKRRSLSCRSHIIPSYFMSRMVLKPDSRVHSVLRGLGPQNLDPRDTQTHRCEKTLDSTLSSPLHLCILHYVYIYIYVLIFQNL